MAWTRGMSSARHHTLSLRSELRLQRGREKKAIPHFPPDRGSPFLWQLGATVISFTAPGPGSSRSSVAPSLSSYRGPLLPIAPLESFFSHKKKDQLYNSQLGPFLLSLTLSFFKLSDRAGLFNLLEAFKMSLTSDGGDNGEIPPA